MLNSLKPEDFQNSLYEELLEGKSRIEETIKTQNYIIGFILGCLLVGGIVLLCIVII